MYWMLQPRLLEKRMLLVGVLSYQMMKPVPNFPTAIYEREHEKEVPPNALREKLGRDAPGFSSAERELEDRNLQKHGGQGTVAKQPREVPPERVYDGDHIDKEIYNTDQPEKSRGEFQ